MRTIKIFVVVAFFATAAIPFISTRVTFASFVSQQKQSASADKPTKSSNGDAAKKTKSGKAAAKVDPALYVGSDACAQCHANESAFFSITAHQKTLTENVPVDKRGCEACHGGAKNHVEFHTSAAKLNEAGKTDEAAALYADAEKFEAASLPSLKELPAAEASAMCLKCHEGEQGRSEERFNFRRSEHHRNGVSCLDCHSSHSPKRTEFLLRDTQPNMCYTCHADQKASFMKPFRHKVGEGTMKCSDCHNQHGEFQPKMLRSGIGSDVTCTKCHADKAGPFVYEHAPIKVEGCQACHTPHGSTNPKMLTKPDVRFLCVECHSNTPGIPEEGTGLGIGVPHDIKNPRYANCTVCHIEIHGSNKDRFYR
jgi:DmsE family decaheme c-type cytochrome